MRKAPGMNLGLLALIAAGLGALLDVPFSGPINERAFSFMDKQCRPYLAADTPNLTVSDNLLRMLTHRHRSGRMNL